MLATALALLCAQAVNFTLLVSAQRNERLASIAASAATQIADASDRVANGLSIDAPRSFARRPETPALRQRGGVQVGPDNVDRRPHRGRVVLDVRPHIPLNMHDAPDVVARVSDLLAETGLSVRAVRAAVGQPRQLIRQPRHRRWLVRRSAMIPVVVAAQLADGRWLTIRTRVAAREPRIGGLLLMQTIILFALLLVPLLWIAWRVTRPLARLASAVGDVRPGSTVAPVPESGPEDVRALTRAFNDMHDRITRLIDDKDRMLGAVGHDLRTPLASLRVRVEQVADDRLREQMIGTITELTIMLEDIVSLARVGHQAEAPTMTDLAALIDDLVADYRAMAQPVSLVPDGAILNRVVRAASVRRALRNLIDNAIAYGGSADVGLAQDAAGRAVLTVDDHGPGIAAGDIDALMEPFARGEQSRNRQTGGSGLGLSLARSIALAEGGDLELCNRTDGGLRATLQLPPSA